MRKKLIAVWAALVVGLALAGVSKDGPAGAATSTPITITSAAGLPNRIGDNEASEAIDGNEATGTYTTPSGATDSPAHLMFGFDSTAMNRIRVLKNGEYGPHNLTIQYSTGTESLDSRVWTTVTNLVNGFEGTELMNATAVNSNGTVTGDAHAAGFASLTFDTVTATGVRISFTSDQENKHYRVFEFEAHYANSDPLAAQTFATPGNYSFVVPAGVGSVTFDVYGGAGGAPSDTVYGGAGGLGGHTGASVAVTEGQSFALTVGAAGQSGDAGGAGGAGNGGGGNGADNGCQCPPRDGGGGGGGSTVMLGLTTLVAAGGGGGGAPGATGGGGGGGLNTAGDGSVPTGITNGTAATGGSPSAAGNGGTQAFTETGGSNGGGGFLGVGGGAGTDYNSAGGGGGGGFRGGGGGSGGFLGGSGAGGSGYLHDSVTSTAAENGTQAGNGKIVITMTPAATTTSSTTTTTSTTTTSTTTPGSTTTTLKPKITVTRPNGGENLPRKSSQAITWNFSGVPNTAKVKILLIKGGKQVGAITTAAPIAPGSFTWNIPGNFTLGSDYKIKVLVVGITPKVTDLSNATFTVSPAVAS